MLANPFWLKAAVLCGLLPLTASALIAGGIGNVKHGPALIILEPSGWWVHTLMVAGLIGFAYGMNRVRLREIERLRIRIATDLHDDIGASLSRIAIVSEVVIQSTEANGLTEQLSEIACAAREMLASMSDIIWAINPACDHLDDITQRMRRFASDVLSARDIEFVFRAPARHELTIDADARRQLFLVFKEAINNIARHSGCKHAEIELTRNGRAIVLEIHDDGTGLVWASSYGNGIRSMQARGAVIASQPGHGTFITARFPIARERCVSEPIQMDGYAHPDSV
jgi:signal transduction histidine kinase